MTSAIFLKWKFHYKRDCPDHFHLYLARSICRVNISDFTLHRFLTCYSQREIQNEISECKYRSWSCQDCQKLQNNTSSHYPATIFALCIYFLQYETPLFRIYAFRTRRLIHTSWLQNLNFKLGALRQKKRRGLAFYTGTSCLKLTTIPGLENSFSNSTTFHDRMTTGMA